MKVINRTKFYSAILLTVVLMLSSLESALQGRRRRRVSHHSHKASHNGRQSHKSRQLPFKFDVKMPGASPHKPEQYICTYRKLPSKQTLYIVEFEPHASKATAHHILLYGCKGVFSRHKKWTCGGSICDGGKIIFGWAKDAPALYIPKGVGFEVGGNSGINYIVMQIHYARTLKVGEYDHSGIILHMTHHKMHYLANIYEFIGTIAEIPAKAKGYHEDMVCKYEKSYDMVPFAFRTHAHGLGRVISAYRIRNDKWSLIGIGNPQLPQAFYDVKPENRMKIHFGDILAARCTYDAPNRTTTTYIGGTSHDEMCNFYMMYYSKNKNRFKRHGDDFELGDYVIDDECTGVAEKLKFPPGNDKLPPELMINGSQHANHVMGGEADDTHGDDGTDDTDDKIKDISPTESSLNTQSKTITNDTKTSKDGDDDGTGDKSTTINKTTTSDTDADEDVLPIDIDEDDSATDEMNSKGHKDVPQKSNHKKLAKLEKDSDGTTSKKLNGDDDIGDDDFDSDIGDDHIDGDDNIDDIGDNDDGTADEIVDVTPNKSSLNGQSKTSDTKISEDKETVEDILPIVNNEDNSADDEEEEEDKPNSKGHKKVSQKSNHKKHTELKKENGKKNKISNKHNTKSKKVSGKKDQKLSSDKINRKQANKLNADKVKMKEHHIKKVNKMNHLKHQLTKPHSESDLKKSNNKSTKQGMESDLDQLMDVDGEDPHGGAVPSHSSHKTKPARIVGKPNVDGDWPYKRKGLKALGQVSGVAINKDGHIVVFHRGPRTWGENTFDMDFRMTNYDSLDPIGVPTILHLDPKTGDVVKKQGNDMFYLPHGLTIDAHDNIWVTDVGSHQIMKFTPNGHLPALMVGQRHEPGDDGEHFCQPADIAVEKSGVFYVADGYCNSRIMKFNAHGKLIKKWGRGNRDAQEASNIPGEFAIPHSLALDEEHNRLYVADRENGRIQVFNTNGKFITQFNHKEFGTSLYALSFNPAHGGILYAVNGPSAGQKRTDALGFTMNGTTGVILNKWRPSSKGFSRPHDIESCPDNSAVYVVEIGPNRVWKFVLPAFKGKPAPTKSNYTEEDDSILVIPHEAKNSELSSKLLPAIVVISVLATPVCLICIAAAVQHMRIQQKRNRILRKRDEDLLLPKSCGISGCCYTKKYYYDHKRGFDKLIGEDSDDSDYFVRKGAI